MCCLIEILTFCQLIHVSSYRSYVEAPVAFSKSGFFDMTIYIGVVSYDVYVQLQRRDVFMCVLILLSCRGITGLTFFFLHMYVAENG